MMRMVSHLVTVTKVNPMNRPRRPPTLETYKIIIITMWGWIKKNSLDKTHCHDHNLDRIDNARFLVDVQNLRLWGVQEHIHHCYIFPDDHDNDKDNDDNDKDDDIEDHDHYNGDCLMTLCIAQATF